MLDHIQVKMVAEYFRARQIAMNTFTIRTYAFITNSRSEILVSNERYKGTSFTKLPGGGVKFGEGILAGLKRELLEELEIDFLRASHVYTCDFLVKNQFNSDNQVIGVYYSVEVNHNDLRKISKDAHLHKQDDSSNLIRREWVSPIELESRLTFPMDRKAAEHYLEKMV